MRTLSHVGTVILRAAVRRASAISLGWLVPVLLIAAGARILGLGNTDLWGDEAFSVMTSLGPPGNLLGILATSEPHPPLYPFLLAVWLRLFGSSEFVARLPSAFAGIASVSVAAALARSFAEDSDRRSATLAAVVAGLLVAVNPFQVWYSQEARMYAQVSFFAGLATLALLRLWQGRRGAIPFYALAIVGAGGSHYYGLFIPLAHGIAALGFARGNRAAFLRWLRATALAAVLYLPWVYLALRVFTSYYGGPPGSENLPQIAHSSWVRIAAGWSLEWPDAVRYAALVSAIALVGLVMPARSAMDRFLRVVLACWLLTPFVGGYVVSLIRPLYNERYLIVTSLPLILLIARGIIGIAGLASGSESTTTDEQAIPSPPTPSPTRGEGTSCVAWLVDATTKSPPRASAQDLSMPPRDHCGSESPLLNGGARAMAAVSATARPLATASTRRVALSPRLRVAWRGVRLLAGTATLGAALGVAYVALHNVWIGEYLKSAYNTHVETVDLLARSGDAVILDGSSQEYLYRYYARKSLPRYTLPRQTPLDPAVTTAALANVARQHDGAWVFWYATPNYDPRNVIGRWLATHGYLSLDVYAANARLQYYRFTADNSLTTRATTLTFGGSLALERYGWLARAVPAGTTVPVDLIWRRSPTAPPHLRVALHLVDRTGFIWAQTDQSIGNDYLEGSDWPANLTLDDRHGVAVPTGTPPGDYLLLLNVYSADHPQAMAVTGQGASINPAGVDLATIHVSAPSQAIWTEGIAGFHPTTVTFASGVDLLGYAGSDTVTAGESGYLTLAWRATRSNLAISQLHLDLLTASGAVAEQRDLPIATSSYPPSQWRTGDVLREQYRIPISARLAPGVYRIGVLPTASSSASTPSPPPAVVGSIAVRPGSPSVAATEPQHPVSFSFDGKIDLSGFDLSANHLQPGSNLALTLYWRDVAPVDSDYTVFVHVLDTSEKIVAQHDQPPAEGKRPTSSWFPGDTILDRYSLKLPADLPPGSYTIEVGMYSPNTGKRLPVLQDGRADGDRILLAPLVLTS